MGGGGGVGVGRRRLANFGRGGHLRWPRRAGGATKAAWRRAHPDKNEPQGAAAQQPTGVAT